MALIPADEQLLAEISQDHADPVELARLIMQYWGHVPRAERTPKEYMYLHIGYVVGLMMKMRRDYMNALQEIEERLVEQAEILEKAAKSREN